MVSVAIAKSLLMSSLSRISPNSWRISHAPFSPTNIAVLQVLAPTFSGTILMSMTFKLSVPWTFKSLSTTPRFSLGAIFAVPRECHVVLMFSRRYCSIALSSSMVYSMSTMVPLSGDFWPKAGSGMRLHAALELGGKTG